MSIGERLREEREKLGYNQTDFAGLGDASLRSQIEWEKGKAFPNAKVLSAIAAAGADVQYILTGVRSLNCHEIKQRGENTQQLQVAEPKNGYGLAEDEMEILRAYRLAAKHRQAMKDSLATHRNKKA